MANKKKAKKRGFPVFATVYWTLLILILAVTAFGLVRLWDICALYESVQPKYVAEPYQKIYTDGDIDTMIALTGGIELNEYEDMDDYKQYVRDILGDKQITCTKEYTSEKKDVLRYVAKADGARFSEFTLVKSGEIAETDIFGKQLTFEKWKFGGMTLDIPAPETTYTVKVFTNYDVYVNGEKLGKEAITKSGIETFASAVKLPGSVYLPEMCVYTFTSHFGDPEVTVKTSDGKAGELIADAGSTTGWHMDLSYSASARKKMESYVLEAAKAYCTFISEDGSRANALKYVVKGSNMESYINAYDDQWFTPHARYDFSNAATWNYYVFSDNCFCCNVQMLFNMYTSAGKRATYPISFRFYFGYNTAKDKWLIFDYETIDFDYDLYNKTK